MAEPALQSQEVAITNIARVLAAAEVATEQVLVNPAALPRRVVRVARRWAKWDLPKRFSGYEAVGPELSVRGAAPKFIMRNKTDPNDWYIVKSAESCGTVETLTELLNNLIGQNLGFPMAHAGLVRADGELKFASHNFQRPDETLIHGSVLFRQTFDDIEGIGKNVWDEQRTFEFDLIETLLRQICGEVVSELLASLIELLVFDALIGSMDRHMQNWGLLATVGEPRTYRFAPIFDSARALLWNCNEVKLETLLAIPQALEGYVNRSKPKIGFQRAGRALSHFELVQHLLDIHPVPTRQALEKVDPKRVERAAQIVKGFPFRAAFSPARKHLIIKVLASRADKLHTIAQKGGQSDVHIKVP
jgi:hypothetical protein